MNFYSEESVPKELEETMEVSSMDEDKLKPSTSTESSFEKDFDLDGISTAKICPSSFITESETSVLLSQNLQANRIFQSAMNLWSEAWIAEENFLVKEAKEKFEKSRNLFTEALQMDSKNSYYLKFAKICALKVDGNETFNDAIELQSQGNNTNLKYLYQEARNKFQKASKIFDEAFLISENLKFIESNKLIDENIQSINMAIKKLQLNTGSNDVNFTF